MNIEFFLDDLKVKPQEMILIEKVDSISSFLYTDHIKLCCEPNLIYNMTLHSHTNASVKHSAVCSVWGCGAQLLWDC